MKYSDWLAEYKKLGEEVDGIPLIDIKEVLSVGGKHFIISLGRENEIREDNHTVDPKYLRPLFTGNKDEFYDVLEMLRTRVQEQRAFAINIANALTEEAVPEVVMARIQGEQVSGDAFDMLKMGARKKLDELAKIAKAYKAIPFTSFSIPMEVAGKTFTFSKEENSRKGPTIHVSWGGVSVTSEIFSVIHVYEVGSLEEDMFFLTNFEFIKEALIKLGTKLTHFLED